MINYIGKCAMCRKEITSIENFYIKENKIVDFLGQTIYIQQVLCKTCEKKFNKNQTTNV